MPQSKAKKAAKAWAKQVPMTSGLAQALLAGQASSSSQQPTQAAPAPAQQVDNPGGNSSTAAEAAPPPTSDPASAATGFTFSAPGAARFARHRAYAAVGQPTPEVIDAFHQQRAQMDLVRLEQRFAAKITELDTANDKNKELRAEVHELRKNIGEKDEQLARYNQQVSDQTAEKDKAVTALQQAKESLREAQNETKGHLDAKDELHKQWTELQEEALKMRKELDNQKKEIKQLADDNADLLQQLEEKTQESDALDEAIKSNEQLNAGMDEAQDSLWGLRQLYRKKSAEAKTLKAQLANYKSSTAAGGSGLGHIRSHSTTSLVPGTQKTLDVELGSHEQLGSDAGSEVAEDEDENDANEQTITLDQEQIRAAMQAQKNDAGESTTGEALSSVPPPTQRADTATPKPLDVLDSKDESIPSGSDALDTSSYPLSEAAASNPPPAMIDRSSNMDSDVVEPPTPRPTMSDSSTTMDSDVVKPPPVTVDSSTTMDSDVVEPPPVTVDSSTTMDSDVVEPPPVMVDNSTTMDSDVTRPPTPPPTMVDSSTNMNPSELPTPYFDKHTSTSDLPKPYVNVSTTTTDAFHTVPANHTSTGSDNPITDINFPRPHTYADRGTFVALPSPKQPGSDSSTQTDTDHTFIRTDWLDTKKPMQWLYVRTPSSALRHRAQGSSETSKDLVPILCSRLPSMRTALIILSLLAMLLAWFIAHYLNLLAFRNAFTVANTPTYLSRASRTGAFPSPMARAASATRYGYDYGVNEGMFNSVFGALLRVLFGWTEDPVAKAQWVVAGWLGIRLGVAATG